MSRFVNIISFGNRTGGAHMAVGDRTARVYCADGFSMSIVAGPGCYCRPRPGDPFSVSERYAGPYHAVEVGYPTARPEPWREWAQYIEISTNDDPTDMVYGYVPVRMVGDLIEAHGGEVSE